MIIEAIEVFLVIYAGGHAARILSDLVLRHEWLTDPICGYKRDTNGTVTEVDPDREKSVFCTWALCFFCQSGWFTLYLVPLLWFLLGMDWNIALLIITWLAAWRVATSLPE